MKISPVQKINYKPYFNANYSKENNVTILGSSKATEQILDSMDKCSQITKQLVLSGRNIITGCGNNGIMGSAYYTASHYSTKDTQNKPEQNLAIIKQPLWGDEDLENCKVINSATSEADRINKFIETANSFIVFPGGPATLQETTTLISNNHYSKNKKQIILIGTKFFRGLDEQYKEMKDSGLIKCEKDELFILTDDINYAYSLINKTK